MSKKELEEKGGGGGGPGGGWDGGGDGEDEGGREAGLGSKASLSTCGDEGKFGEEAFRDGDESNDDGEEECFPLPDPEVLSAVTEASEDAVADWSLDFPCGWESFPRVKSGGAPLFLIG